MLNDIKSYLRESRCFDKRQEKKQRHEPKMLVKAEALLNRPSYEKKVLAKMVKDHRTIVKKDYGIFRGTSYKFLAAPGSGEVEATDDVRLLLFINLAPFLFKSAPFCFLGHLSEGGQGHA